MATTACVLLSTRTYLAPFCFTQVIAQPLCSAFAPLAPHPLSLIQPVQVLPSGFAAANALKIRKTTAPRVTSTNFFFIFILQIFCWKLPGRSHQAAVQPESSHSRCDTSRPRWDLSPQKGFRPAGGAEVNSGPRPPPSNPARAGFELPSTKDPCAPASSSAMLGGLREPCRRCSAFRGFRRDRWNANPHDARVTPH